MANINVSLKNTQISNKTIMEYKDKVEKIHNDLHKRANDPNDFVGWLELPTNYDKKEFARIKKLLKKKKRIRYFSSYWNRRIILRCKSCNRVFNKYIL